MSERGVCISAVCLVVALGCIVVGFVADIDALVICGVVLGPVAVALGALALCRCWHD